MLSNSVEQTIKVIVAITTESGSDSRFLVREAIDPASPACSHAAAETDKIHFQQACAFQERVPFRTAAASSHRFEFNVVQCDFTLRNNF